MSDRIYNQSYDFACAYIQTLPHIKKREEFESDESFENYLDERQKTYFSEYLRTVSFSHREFKEMDTKGNDEN